MKTEKCLLPDLGRAYNAQMQWSNLVVVQSYGSRAEAELAKGALKAAGIEAITQADTVGGMRDHIAWSGECFQILVRGEDLTAAREVLTQTAIPLTNSTGESSDPNF